jgi:hypothetical protein
MMISGSNTSTSQLIVTEAKGSRVRQMQKLPSSLCSIEGFIFFSGFLERRFMQQCRLSDG